MPKYKTVDEYIQTFPEDIQKKLNRVREVVRNAVPDALETFGYGVPAFKLNGKYLIYYAAFKNHIGIYPAPDGVKAFEKELREYQTSKGTIQFPYDKPIPYDLIEKVVKYKLEKLR